MEQEQLSVASYRYVTRASLNFIAREMLGTSLLVDEGRIDEETLKSIERDEEWLLDALKRQGYSRIEDIFYCEWITGDGLHVVACEDESSMEVKLDG